MTAPELRLPVPSDVPDIFTVLAQYRVHPLGTAEQVDPDFPADSVLHLRNSIVDVDLEQRSLVATLDDELVGFCCWDWLDASAAIAKTVLITVLPSARGSGVGRMLQQARMDAMWAAGAQSIHTASDDPASVAWYIRHFGYRSMGRVPICHALHRLHWRDQSWWAIHRGFPQHDTIENLVVDRPQIPEQV